jgi:hypothetical protein
LSNLPTFSTMLKPHEINRMRDRLMRSIIDDGEITKAKQWKSTGDTAAYVCSFLEEEYNTWKDVARNAIESPFTSYVTPTQGKKKFAINQEDRESFMEFATDNALILYTSSSNITTSSGSGGGAAASVEQDEEEVEGFCGNDIDQELQVMQEEQAGESEERSRAAETIQAAWRHKVRTLRITQRDNDTAVVRKDEVVRNYLIQCLLIPPSSLINLNFLLIIKKKNLFVTFKDRG